jgi:hypothetical protein
LQRSPCKSTQLLCWAIPLGNAYTSLTKVLEHLDTRSSLYLTVRNKWSSNTNLNNFLNWKICIMYVWEFHTNLETHYMDGPSTTRGMSQIWLESRFVFFGIPLCFGDVLEHIIKIWQLCCVFSKQIFVILFTLYFFGLSCCEIFIKKNIHDK